MVEVCRAITKHHYLVQSARDMARVVKEAFHIASTGRPGPVLIDVPKDIQNTLVPDPDYDVPMDLPGYRLPAGPTPEQIEQVVAAIKASKKPIIYCGGGVVASGAAESLRTFAEKTKIPVAMTLQGLGSMPSEHYLSLGMLGMHGTVYSNYAINDADLLLALGVRFDDRVTGKLSEFAKHGRIVHVDIDASEINKNKAAHIAIHSDVKTFLDAINPRVEPGDYREWHQQIDAWREADPMTYDQRDDAIMPQYVIDKFSELTKGEFVMTTGVGQHQMWAAQWTRFKNPRTWITSGGLGSMGFGLPAAMGAQAGCPGKLVVDIDGDGSFLMNIQELGTVFCENLPVKVIVLNNQHLGMVVQWEDRFHAGNRAHTYLGPVDHPEATGQGTGALPEVTYPDFVTIAKGLRRQGPAGPQQGGGRGRPQGNDRARWPVRARRPRPVPGARPADDPRRSDRSRHHQELTAPVPRERRKRVAIWTPGSPNFERPSTVSSAPGPPSPRWRPPTPRGGRGSGTSSAAASSRTARSGSPATRAARRTSNSARTPPPRSPSGSPPSACSSALRG